MFDKALYAIGIPTTRKFVSTVHELSLSPTLTDSLFIPRGKVTYPPNPTMGTSIDCKSFSLYCKFLDVTSECNLNGLE